MNLVNVHKQQIVFDFPNGTLPGVSQYNMAIEKEIITDLDHDRVIGVYVNYDTRDYMQVCDTTLELKVGNNTVIGKNFRAFLIRDCNLNQRKVDQATFFFNEVARGNKIWAKVTAKNTTYPPASFKIWLTFLTIDDVRNNYSRKRRVIESYQFPDIVNKTIRFKTNPKYKAIRGIIGAWQYDIGIGDLIKMSVDGFPQLPQNFNANLCFRSNHDNIYLEKRLLPLNIPVHQSDVRFDISGFPQTLINWSEYEGMLDPKYFNDILPPCISLIYEY